VAHRRRIPSACDPRKGKTHFPNNRLMMIPFIKKGGLAFWDIAKKVRIAEFLAEQRLVVYARKKSPST